jgi:hypothetical protein
VRVLSVAPAPFRAHTVHMATDTRDTTFVTEAAGFIRSELVKLLFARRDAADRLRCRYELLRFDGPHRITEDIPRGSLLRGRAASHPRLNVFTAYIVAGGLCLGFRVHISTLEHGLQQVIGPLDEQ